MTQNTPIVPSWLVTDDNRARAQIKYELNHLESRLYKYLEQHPDLNQCPEDVKLLCGKLAQQYQAYQKLLIEKSQTQSFELPCDPATMPWLERLHLITSLKKQLSQTVEQDEKLQIIFRITNLYLQFKESFHDLSNINFKKLLPQLRELFQKPDMHTWLDNLVAFWNQNDGQHQDLSLLLRGWDLQQQQTALECFINPELVQLANAIFFYKLYPDKLFHDFIHPEKLVSVQMRLSMLHRFIEMLQHQLYLSAKQHGLRTGIDYLFHGDELPQGIMIEVNEAFREIILAAVKKLKIQFTPENELQVTLGRLHDLGLAYKFWFNPNRLIDAVMVLKRRLVNPDLLGENCITMFRQEMLALYSQLTTTDCLNLYGYFSNNDSRYLLYTLFIIVEGRKVDWLPVLKSEEKIAIYDVFQSLQCVMEALRDALKARHVNTAPYVYDLEKDFVKAGRRNQEAVFRIISIYGRESISTSDAVEQLFRYVEDTNQD